MDSNKSSSGGVGIATVLFLIFLVLKLCDVISWSWWWVTSPLWISFGLWLIIMVSISIYFAVEKRRWEKQYGDRSNKTIKRHRW